MGRNLTQAGEQSFERECDQGWRIGPQAAQQRARRSRATVPGPFEI
jgi:hypothetical protein